MSNGTLINNNNLNDNQKKNGMFNFLKTETITTNKQPGNINIYSSINSNWEGGTSGQTADLRDKRVYKSNFRQPIQAVRKETNCNDNEQCQKVTKLYKDHYSLNDKNGKPLNEKFKLPTYAEGGEIDLFEQYDKQPKKLSKIVEKYEERYG